MLGWHHPDSWSAPFKDIRTAKKLCRHSKTRLSEIRLNYWSFGAGTALEVDSQWPHPSPPHLYCRPEAYSLGWCWCPRCRHGSFMSTLTPYLHKMNGAEWNARQWSATWWNRNTWKIGTCEASRFDSNSNRPSDSISKQLANSKIFKPNQPCLLLCSS